MRNPLFYAKILLFGEYGIIEDSKGLTIPYNSYKGSLKFEENSQGKISNESPLGRVLLGAKVGQTVRVNAPNGTINFRIVRID